MYCRNCGKLLNDEDKFCKHCGNKIIKEVVAVKEEKKEEKASIGWWFLAFFIPIIGFILFLIYRIDRKKRSKRLLSGTISGIVVFVISVITIISLLASLLTKGMYKCVQIESDNSMHYVKTSVLKLMDDEDAINGDFIISTDEICEYYDIYDIFGGEVKIEILVTRIGTWERSNNDEIKLITYQETYLYNFSGEGKDEYIKSIKDDYEIIYGYSATKKIFTGQELVIDYPYGLVSHVSLNEDDKTYVEYYL